MSINKFVVVGRIAANKKKEQKLIIKDYLEEKLKQLNILDIYNNIKKQNDN